MYLFFLHQGITLFIVFLLDLSILLQGGFKVQIDHTVFYASLYFSDALQAFDSIYPHFSLYGDKSLPK